VNVQAEEICICVCRYGIRSASVSLKGDFDSHKAVFCGYFYIHIRHEPDNFTHIFGGIFLYVL
jgi:hypothetical protein